MLTAIIAIVLAYLIGSINMSIIIAKLSGLTALAAVVGHIFPIFFQFKGGKGVATTLGVLLVLNLWIGLFALAVWGLVAYLSKYASLA